MGAWVLGVECRTSQFFSYMKNKRWSEGSCWTDLVAGQTSTAVLSCASSPKPHPNHYYGCSPIRCWMPGEKNITIFLNVQYLMLNAKQRSYTSAFLNMCSLTQDWLRIYRSQSGHCCSRNCSQTHLSLRMKKEPSWDRVVLANTARTSNLSYLIKYMKCNKYNGEERNPLIWEDFT